MTYKNPDIYAREARERLRVQGAYAQAAVWRCRAKALERENADLRARVRELEGKA